MKSLSFLIVLFLWANTASAQSGQYCNADFGFCLEYPATFSMLTAKGQAKAPVRFVSGQGQVQVEIAGYNNTESWSLEDIYYLNFEDQLRENPDLEILEENFTKDGFELLYQEKGQLHFFRVHRQLSKYIILSVFLPSEERSRLPALRERLQIVNNTP